MKNDNHMLNRDRKPFRTFRKLYVTACACACGVMFAGGCDESSTPAPKARTLTGNWGSPGYSDGAMSLIETNVHVTGYGWIGGSSTALVLDGARDGESVLLKATLPTRNGSALTFRGEFSHDALVGDFNGQGGRVSMVRVDTVATGIAEVTYSSTYPTRKDDVRFLVFDGRLLIYVNTRNPLIQIEGPAIHLVPGKYPLGPEGPNTFSAGFGVGSGSVSGELTITFASKRALMVHSRRECPMAPPQWTFPAPSLPDVQQTT